MVDICTLSSSTYQPLPLKFEAGTPHIAGVIGLEAALDFLSQFDQKELQEHEKKLSDQLQQLLSDNENIRLVGRPKTKRGLFSFSLNKGHPLDLATLLDAEGIALRSGHLCSQPALHRFGLSSFLRVSLGIYNTEDDIQQFKRALHQMLPLLSK